MAQFDRDAYVQLIAERYKWRTDLDSPTGPRLYVSSQDVIRNQTFASVFADHVLAFCADNGIVFDVARQGYRIRRGGNALLAVINERIGAPGAMPLVRGQRILLVDQLALHGDDLVRKTVRYNSCGLRAIPLALLDRAASPGVSSVGNAFAAIRTPYYPMAFAGDVVQYDAAVASRVFTLPSDGE